MRETFLNYSTVLNTFQSFGNFEKFWATLWSTSQIALNMFQCGHLEQELSKREGTSTEMRSNYISRYSVSRAHN